MAGQAKHGNDFLKLIYANMEFLCLSLSGGSEVQCSARDSKIHPQPNPMSNRLTNQEASR